LSSTVSTLIDLLTRPEFVWGVGLGSVLLVALGLLRPHTGWAVSTAIATTIGVQAVAGGELNLIAGLVLLSLGGFLIEKAAKQGRHRPELGIWGWVAIGVGGVVVAFRTGLPEGTWLRWLVPIVIAGSGHLLARWKDLPNRTLVGPLFALSAFGIWATVPETETARVLVGASLALSLATIRPLALSLSAAGSFPLVGLTTWIAATSGVTRPASIVGAWACLGVLAIMPLLKPLNRSFTRGLIVVVHLVLVYLTSRVFGLWVDAAPAAWGSLLVLGVAYWALAQLKPRSQGPV
jgi:hypothetical protein